MAHQLPSLPYAFDALEPHIDAQTMQIHHGKHHQAYVNNLNAALESHPDLQGKSVEDLIKDLNALPEAIRTAVRNNGGGHANHTLFWNLMGPNAGGAPTGKAADAINGAFGSFDTFKEQMNKGGVGRFGSGWVWLVLDGGKGKIVTTPNAETPLTTSAKPLITCDVWEHAYYIDYRNKRDAFLEVFCDKLVNWDFAAKNLKG